MNLISVTPKALSKIESMLSSSEYKAIRFSANSGGCSGFSYSLTFDTLENINKLDELVELDTIKIIVDGMSIPILAGVEIDWIEDLMGSYFKFNNPNSRNSCGCGSSFSV